jgi:hypothetical protein
MHDQEFCRGGFMKETSKILIVDDKPEMDGYELDQQNRHLTGPIRFYTGKQVIHIVPGWT